LSAPTSSVGPALESGLQTRLANLFDEGCDLWNRFDLEVRQKSFHPFVAADYDVVLEALLPLRAPGVRFLEWGSATGVITIMADLLGFEAYGIEIDDHLVGCARDLTARSGSGAQFAGGSFLPSGYRSRRNHDGRLGTIGYGSSGYLDLGIPLDDFDIVFGYPWSGEEPIMLDLMNRYGRVDARLLLNSTSGGVTSYEGGKVVDGSGELHLGSRTRSPSSQRGS
jgi:hypothetical protein